MIKIAILGAGFFGLHLANTLRSALKEKLILDIFESAAVPFNAVSANNQCRLHLGYHYPRSGYTIYQSVSGSSEFLTEYKSAVRFIADNYYFIHRDGLVNSEKYLAVMDSFSLAYKKSDSIPEWIVDREKIEAAILTEESYIDLGLLKSFLLSRNTDIIYLNTEIFEIDSEKGILYSSKGHHGSYDLIINCTYSNPNLGLESNNFKLKYELAAMVLAETNLTSNEAITIMDGPFVSVYPATERYHTLSSVVHTPFLRFTDVSDFKRAYNNRFQLASEMDVQRKIISHIRQSLDISINPNTLWVTGKTKLATDKGDSRETLLKRNNRVISVLCGKLDSVYQASLGVMGAIHEFI